MSLLRLYSIDECGRDGYPRAWDAAIKDLVRLLAGFRCERCGHPYRNGEHGSGEWSPCDERCAHPGPLRVMDSEGVWIDEEDVAAWQSQGAIVEARWRILTVHHLDGNKLNCRWWNLPALCQRCHLRIQTKVRMEQTYPFEHSEWFKPYAAGYYAFSYLGEDLTRQEAVTRLNELLALEQVVGA
jgi:hypothetical protein